MFGVSLGLRHQKWAKATKQMSQTIITSSVTSRLDIFNLLNKVNLDNPLPCVDCPGGRIIISTAFRGVALQRQILFSLRLQF